MTPLQMSEIMDHLYINRAPHLPASALAEVFDRLIWCLADQGEALLQVKEDWLMSEDKGRVEIALAMDETYPFAQPEQMEMVFAKISSRWPDLRPRCSEILAARRSENV